MIVYHYLADYVDTSVVPIAVRHEMMKKNSNCFHLVTVSHYPGSTTLVGIFVIFPLTRQSSEDIAASRIIGINLTEEHIVKSPYGTCSSCYINFVWSSDSNKFFKPYSAEVVRLCYDRIMKIPKHKKDFKIFAMPTNKQAVRILRNFGFSSLTGGDVTAHSIATLNLNSFTIKNRTLQNYGSR
ncbi:hypothetical protein IP86_18995 [Rhodopseudomonas sp. AAP120]|nr:hypothetical protein IP86_18995 [Rhodopseudomonas sp. AAP120]